MRRGWSNAAGPTAAALRGRRPWLLQPPRAHRSLHPHHHHHLPHPPHCFCSIHPSPLHLSRCFSSSPLLDPCPLSVPLLLLLPSALRSLLLCSRKSASPPLLLLDPCPLSVPLLLLLPSALRSLLLCSRRRWGRPRLRMGRWRWLCAWVTARHGWIRMRMWRWV